VLVTPPLSGLVSTEGLVPPQQSLIDATGGVRTSGRLGATTTINPGDCCMLIDGVAYPAKSAAALGGLLLTLGSTIPGADANGGILLYSNRPATKVQLLDGTSKSLGLDSVVYGAGELDVKIQLATDGGGAITSNALALAAFINSHALLRGTFGIHAAATGTGLGLSTVAALTAISLVGLAGWSRGAYVNATGAIVDREMAFDVGVNVMAVSGTITRAQVPGRVGIVNATQIRPITGLLDLDVLLTNVAADGTAYVQIP